MFSFKQKLKVGVHWQVREGEGERTSFAPTSSDAYEILDLLWSIFFDQAEWKYPSGQTKLWAGSACKSPPMKKPSLLFQMCSTDSLPLNLSLKQHKSSVWRYIAGEDWLKLKLKGTGWEKIRPEPENVNRMKTGRGKTNKGKTGSNLRGNGGNCSEEKNYFRIYLKKNNSLK